MIARTKRSIFAKWWRLIDKAYLYSIFFLAAIGVVLVMAASKSVAVRIGLDQNYFAMRHGVFIVLGISVMLAISLLDNILTRRLAILGFLSFFMLLLLVEFSGFETKGARRWIYLFGQSIQPSEVLKPFFAIFNAWMIARYKKDNNFPGMIISFVSFALIIILLVRQPDFGMSVAFGVIWFAQHIVAGLSWFVMGFLFLLGLLAIFSAYNFLPHVAHRINMFLESGGESYQTQKSLLAFENGGVLGTGPATGRIKDSLPDAHTDFIFSVAGEEYGLVLCLPIIALFCFVAVRPLTYISRENDIFKIIALTGLSMQLFFQSFVNMGVAINLLPNTGMTLPFISYGGSSMLAVAVASGLILSLTKQSYGR